VACQIYNAETSPKITPVVVRLRVEEWDIKIITPKGKRGPSDAPKPIQPPAVAKVTSHPVTVQPVVPQRVEVAAIRYTPGMLLVHAPSGECPVKLPGTSYEQLVTWGQAVQAAGREQSRIYRAYALSYFLRHFIDMNTREFREARAVIMENFAPSET
jgi:hypothetical protein